MTLRARQAARVVDGERRRCCVEPPPALGSERAVYLIARQPDLTSESERYTVLPFSFPCPRLVYIGASSSSSVAVAPGVGKRNRGTPGRKKSRMKAIERKRRTVGDRETGGRSGPFVGPPVVHPEKKLLMALDLDAAPAVRARESR